MRQLALLLLTCLLFGCQTQYQCEEFFEPIAPDGFTLTQIGNVSPDVSTSSGLSYFQMVNASNGFAVSPAGLHKTTDGGVSWSVTPIPFEVFIVSALFTSENTGYISYRTNTDGTFLLKTTDGGANWQNLTIEGFDYYFEDLRTDQAGNLYALAGNFGQGAVVKSTDGGITWTEIYASDASSSTRLLTVNGGQLYFMESGDQMTVLDLDGNLVKVSTVGGYEQLVVLDEDNVISVDQNSIYKTSDGGNDWTQIYDRSGTVLDFSNEDGLLMLLSTMICSDRPIDPTSFARGTVNSNSLDISTKKIYDFEVSDIYNVEKIGAGLFLLQYGNEIYEIRRI